MAHISELEKQKIIELYVQGKTIQDISLICGRGKTSIVRIVKDVHRETSVHNKCDLEMEKEIVRLYTKEGLNTVLIAQKFDTYNTTIRRILLRNNIALKSYGEARRIIHLEDIKVKEGTSDFDYFLGVLATDGCVTGNKVVLDFSEENREILEYWNEFLGNKCNITCSTHKVFKVPQYRIAFSNPEIVDYFKLFGIVPNKTFDLHLKYINWNVLRGIIDGDGCILQRNNNTTVTICITSGCLKFLEQIQKFLEELGIKSYLKESHRNLNTTYDLFIYKTADVLFIYEHLYKNAHYFLKRKELKFGSLLEKSNRQPLVNSGKETRNSNPEPSPNGEGVETLHELPKE